MSAFFVSLPVSLPVSLLVARALSLHLPASPCLSQPLRLSSLPLSLGLYYGEGCDGIYNFTATG